MKTKKQYALYPCVSPLGSGTNRGFNSNDKKFYFEEARELEDAAVFDKSQYSIIFGKKRNQAKEVEKYLSVIKISYLEGKDGKGKKHSIYRRFYALTRKDLNGKVAVSLHSLLFLKNGDESLSGATVEVSKGSRLLFFLRHPNIAVRSSSYLGIISIGLGILSIILSVVLS